MCVWVQSTQSTSLTGQGAFYFFHHILIHLKNTKEESWILEFMLACEAEYFSTMISSAIAKVW